jgi:hypothetical protein
VWDLEGVRYEKPKLKMSGIEAVKSSTPAVCRDGLKKAFDFIMNKSELELQTFIAQFRDEFKAMPFDAIAFPRGVTDLGKWVDRGPMMFKSGTPIHVKGSILFNQIVRNNGLSNKYQAIADGDKIKFCYLKKPNPYSSNVISAPGEMPEEFDLDRYLDRDLQFSKAYLDAINPILDAIGWQHEKRSTLDSFFS